MTMRGCLRMIALAALALMAVGGEADADNPGAKIAMSPDTGVPDIYFYHGMVLDQNFNLIEPTFDNVSRITRLFADGLANQATQADHEKFDAMRKSVMNAVALDADSEIMLNVTLARWLLQREKFQAQDRLEGMRRALEAWATIPTRQGIDGTMARNIPLFSALKGQGLDKPMTIAPAVKDYIDECRKAGVPIPPDWGDPAWKPIYPLDPSYSFVNDPNSIAQVWVYEDPASPKTGVCIALPRLDKVTGDIDLFGIICQNSSNVNADPTQEPQPSACFWDNIDKATNARLTPEQSLVMKINEIEDGSMLGENCTNCHRGMNVFNIHPKTALDLSAIVTTNSSKWVQPISGQNGWGNPLGTITLDSNECGQCHQQFPALHDANDTAKSSEYCRILRQVVDKTMPKGSFPAGWLNPTKDYRDDVNTLRAVCDAALPGFRN